MIITLTLPPEAREVKRWITDAVKAAAIQGMSQITTRTTQGLSSNYSPFKAYTPAYRLLKVATGRNAKPDLTLTGEMLRGLKLLDARDGVATIGFTGQHRATSFGKAQKKQTITDVQSRKSLGKRSVKHTIQRGGVRVAASIPMATLVLANDRIRPFFRLTHPRDLKAMADAAQARIDALIEQWNSQQ